MLTENEMNILYKAIETAKKGCKDIYAQLYLGAITEAGVIYGEEGVKVQLLYILGNLQQWRGEEARQTKKVFKDCIKKMD